MGQPARPACENLRSPYPIVIAHHVVRGGEVAATRPVVVGTVRQSRSTFHADDLPEGYRTAARGQSMARPAMMSRRLPTDGRAAGLGQDDRMAPSNRGTCSGASVVTRCVTRTQRQHAAYADPDETAKQPQSRSSRRQWHR